MFGEEVLFFYQIVTPIIGLAFLVTGLIALMSRKKHGATKATKTCLCIMLVLALGWTALLLRIRSNNIAYLHGEEDQNDTETVLYWDDYADSFHYNGEKYVSISYRKDIPEWFWFSLEELDEQDFDDKWQQEHKVFTLHERQSVGDWLTAYDSATAVFSLESGTGETIFLSEGHGYHCREKAIDSIFQYYSDFNNYDFYIKDKKAEDPSQKTITTLNQILNQKGKVYKRQYESYTLHIISKDSIYDGYIDVALVDGSYYFVDYESDDSYDDETKDIFYKIPGQAASELQKYLYKDDEDDYE